MTWTQRHTDWRDVSVRYCDATGQLLPRKYWTFEHDGKRIDVRDPSCEELYRNYIVPRQKDS